MKNYQLRYGLGGGLVLTALGLINWWVFAPLGYHTSQAIGYLSMVIALFCVPMGIKYFRDRLNNGELPFGKGFKIGIGITSLTALVMYIYSVLFFHIAGDKFLTWSENSMSADKWQEMKSQMENMPEFMLTPLFQGLVMFLTVFLIGLAMTVVSSLVLRTTTK